jgi:hypothetical protein
MELEEIYTYLCNRDSRSDTFYIHQYAYAQWEEPLPEPRKNCYCDNCFYGKDKLALEIIRLNNIINQK